MISTVSVLFALLVAANILYSSDALLSKHRLSNSMSPKTLNLSETCNEQQNQKLCGSIKVSLEKPLGITLEEVEQGKPSGVYVLDLDPDGSAATLDVNVSGMKVAKVMGKDVLGLDFDSIMDEIISAPSTVTIEFLTADNDDKEQSSSFAVGSAVSLKIKDGNKEKIIEAKVGENLRKVLLDNNVEVYKGLKQKLGNCGGGGQCTFCNVEFEDDSEGWEPRSDYENQRLPNNPAARLSCLNNIQGPATIKV